MQEKTEKATKKEKVTLIRIYTDEGDSNINRIVQQLHKRGDVVGVTVFRGIAGFGDKGHIHQSSLIDLANDLPIVIELYHCQDKSDEMINFIHTLIDNAHIISWDVNLSFEHVE